MPLKTIPTLYKYMTTDRFISNVKSGSIRFTQPKYLNDPYECHLTFDRFAYIADYRKYRKQAQPGISDKELDKAVAIAEDQLIIDGLLQYREVRDSFGVLSLSEDPKNILMWSHYGDEHQGVCVEMDIWNSALRPGSHGGDKYSGFEQVKYTSNKVTGTPTPQKIVEVLSTKAKEWAYEKEWRLIRTINTLRFVGKNDIYVCDFSISDIKTIYLGAHFPGEKLKELKEVTSSPEGKHIKVIKLDIAPHKFELRETPVEQYGMKLLHRGHHFGEASKEALVCLPMGLDITQS